MPYHMMTQDGKHCIAKDGEDKPIPGGCHATEAEAQAHMAALHANVPDAKSETTNSEYYQSYVFNFGVKAVGDWELDVLAVPFVGKDSDGQWFDANTDLMLAHFPTPPAVYYHSIKEGTRDFADKPDVIGTVTRAEKRNDGVWARVMLNKASAHAARVWEAAKQGLAVASSGTIKHLARLEVGGRLVPYDKGTPGRIAVWPFGELSLWDSGPGMARQAHPYAVATPAFKAVYEQAGLTLPDIDLETESEQADAAGGIPQSAAAKHEAKEETKSNKRKTKMENEEKKVDTVDIQAEVKAQVEAALKAQADAAKADAEAKEAEDKRIADAIKAEREKWEKEAAKARRLPFGEDNAPVVGKFGFDRKYAHLSSADLAFAVEVMRSNHQHVSENTYRSLALKLSTGKEEHEVRATEAMKMDGFPFDGEAIKADEINYSTLASYGDEWVVTANSDALWNQIRHESMLLSKIPVQEVPQGAESVKVFLESTDPVFYKVSQATSDADTSGLSRPAPVVPSSRLGTANQTVTVAEMGARVRWTTTFDEDSIIPVANQLRAQMGEAARIYVEHVLIDGDTATTASTNINDIAGTPAGTEAFLLMDGIRKYALTNNSRSGGTFDEDDFLLTAAELGTSGEAADPAKCFFIVGPHENRKALTNITAIKTRDVYGNPTIENGMLTNLWGYPIYQTFAAGYVFKYSATSIAGYERKYNTAGKIDLDTAGNNTTGVLMLVRPDQWRVGMKRRVTVETDRDIEAQVNIIVTTLRFGLQYRDTAAAAAITYNLTV